MKKTLKIIIYLIGFIFILLIGIRLIDYHFLSIKSEYSNLSKLEINKLKDKFSISENDLNNNLESYEILLKYIKDNSIIWIGLNNSGRLFINSEHLKSSDVNELSLPNGHNIINEFNNLGIYQINDQSIIESFFNKGIAFVKNEIRYERGIYRGYLHYDGDVPIVMNKEKINVDIEILNKNWLIFSIKYKNYKY